MVDTTEHFEENPPPENRVFALTQEEKSLENSCLSKVSLINKAMPQTREHINTGQEIVVTGVVTVTGGNTTKEKDLGMDAKQPIIEKIIDELRGLSEANQQKALEMLQVFNVEAAAETENPLSTTNIQPEIPCPTTKAEMKALGMETYPKFKKRTKKADGKACLLEHWKPWLKDSDDAPDRDHLCQAELRNVDPQLLARLRAQYSVDELNEFLPTNRVIAKQEAGSLSVEEAKKLRSRAQSVIHHAQIA